MNPITVLCPFDKGRICEMSCGHGILRRPIGEFPAMRMRRCRRTQPFNDFCPQAGLLI